MPTQLDHLATELLLKIFTFLDRPQAFSLSCRKLHYITKDPHARADYFLRKYGPRLAIFYSIKNHAKIVNKATAEALISSGAIVSRNLAQRLVKDYLERQPNEYFRCCWTSKLSFGTYLVFLNKAYELYGDNLWAKDAMDDWEQFRICVSLLSGVDFDLVDQPNNTSDSNRDYIKELVNRYQVVPLPLQYCYAAISDTFVTTTRLGDQQLLDMALYDLSKFDHYEFVNIVPTIIEKLIYNKPTPQHLKKPLDNLFSYKYRILEELALELIRNCGLYNVPNIILETLIERRDSLPFDLNQVVIRAINDKFHSIYMYNGAPDNIEALYHYFPEFRDQIRDNLITLFSNTHYGGIVCNRNDASYYGYGVGCVAMGFILSKFGPNDQVTELCFDAIVRDVIDKDAKSTNSQRNSFIGSRNASYNNSGRNNNNNASVDGTTPLKGSPEFFIKYIEAGVRVRPEHLKMVVEKGMKRKWFLKELFVALEKMLKGEKTVEAYHHGRSRTSSDLSKVAPSNLNAMTMTIGALPEGKHQLQQNQHESSLEDKKALWRKTIEEVLDQERESRTAKQWSTKSRLYRMLEELYKRHFR
ncbi:10949_t:CDS:1 [Ambispora gerdemannii]|uniref:10949_t:CDS:1 n=1 Tax=Ambispora gerdemannii TaxID=144530 RepID=A0A9N9FK25_9GLOM|nr:10949_t:CDS:1 [Ambispora gerdemannii]